MRIQPNSIRCLELYYYVITDFGEVDVLMLVWLIQISATINQNFEMSFEPSTTWKAACRLVITMPVVVISCHTIGGISLQTC